MKYEWRKQEKEWYKGKKEAGMVSVPMQKFIMMQGKGNPNNEDFSLRVGALYSMAYGIKMFYKKAVKEMSQIQYDDFSVYPLEGIWRKPKGAELVKETLEYTIMIRQPDFVTEEIVEAAFEKVKEKKADPLLDQMKFSSLQDGNCIEILHIGSYDDEPESFFRMDQFAQQQGMKRTGDWHREIYLSNAKRCQKSRLKTILRYPVESIE